MGCYDTVLVPCPKCGEMEDFQSKGGDCFLAVYDLDKAPVEVLSDVNRHAPVTCEKCGTVFGVMIKFAVEKCQCCGSERGTVFERRSAAWEEIVEQTESRPRSEYFGA
jgi:hypothetical protein